MTYGGPKLLKSQINEEINDSVNPLNAPNIDLKIN